MTYSPTITADGRKICAACKEPRPLDRFSTNGTSALADGSLVQRLRAYCLQCDAKRVAEWRSRVGRNPDEGRKRHLRDKYGLTMEQYESMVMAQCGLCAVCGELPVGYVEKLVIHHDHETGAVRALLCSACNIGIGKLKDRADLLRVAASLQEEVVYSG